MEKKKIRLDLFLAQKLKVMNKKELKDFFTKHRVFTGRDEIIFVDNRKRK